MTSNVEAPLSEEPLSEAPLSEAIRPPILKLEEVLIPLKNEILKILPENNIPVLKMIVKINDMLQSLMEVNVQLNEEVNAGNEVIDEMQEHIKSTMTTNDSLTHTIEMQKNRIDLLKKVNKRLVWHVQNPSTYDPSTYVDISSLIID